MPHLCRLRTNNNLFRARPRRTPVRNAALISPSSGRANFAACPKEGKKEKSNSNRSRHVAVVAVPGARVCPGSPRCLFTGSPRCLSRVCPGTSPRCLFTGSPRCLSRVSRLPPVSFYRYANPSSWLHVVLWHSAMIRNTTAFQHIHVR